MKIKIGKIKYAIVFEEDLRDEDGEKCWGLCDAPGVEDPEIQLDMGLKGKRLLNVALHEGLHLTNKDYVGMPNYEKRHRKVYQDAEVLTEILWGLGFRQIKDIK